MRDLLSKLGLKKSRFIRQCAKRHKFELTYSTLFKEWRKDKNKNVYRLKLLKSGLWPAQISEVSNIMYVLIKKNGITHKDIVEIAIKLWDTYQLQIEEYYQKKYPFRTRKPLSQKKAFKEQKARGFVPLNDFDDFDRKYDHIQSTIDRDYYYPVNFPCKPEQLMRDRKLGERVIIAYGAISAIGVRGYTRVEKRIAQ